jgi:WD40 repeat protein
LLAATGWASGTKLLDTATGRLVRDIPGGGAWWPAAFSPDGERLACGESRTFVFAVADGQKLFEAEGTQAAFSADGKFLLTLAAGRDAQLVRFWDAATGEAVRERRYGPGVQEMAVAAARPVIALLDRDDRTRIRVEDLNTGNEIRTLLLPGDNEQKLALAPDGKELAFVNSKGRVAMWDVAAGKEIRHWDLRATARPVFSPDGRRLAWTGVDDQKRESVVWVACRDGAPPLAMGTTVSFSEPPCFSPDGKVLALLTRADVVQFREVDTGRAVLPLTGHDSLVMGLTFTPDGRHVVSRGLTEVISWETRTGKLLRHFPTGGTDGENVAEILPGGLLLTGDVGARLYRLREPRTGRELWRFAGRPDADKAAVAPGGRYVAVRGPGGEVCVLDAAGGRRVYQFDPGGDVFAPKLSADGDVLAWHGRVPGGFAIKVRHQKAGREWAFRVRPEGDALEPWLEHQPYLSPDGRWVIRFNGVGGGLRRWDLTTGQENAPLVTGGRQLCWSPDSRLVSVKGTGPGP